MPTNRNLVRREVETYAGVLLEAAKASGTVFEVETGLREADKAVRANMNLRDVLEESTYTPESRASIVRAVFEGQDASLVSTLAVMAQRGEMKLLPRVAEEYAAKAEDATGTVVVDVTTVVELTDGLRETIRKKLSASFPGKKIVLAEHIDKSILGGIIMSAHGKRIDASVTSQLENARLVLSSVSGGDR